MALIEPDKNNRENSFAKTFQALGQVMHLIQDMAVPAHVRNDFTAHLVYQKAGWSFPSKWYGNSYEWFVKDKPNLDISGKETEIKNIADSVSSGVKSVTSLWDTDSYTGSNPSTSTLQGLSEYTNGNFFSESTIFADLKAQSDIHYFPRPSKSDTYAELIEVIAEDGQTDHAWYVKKIASNYKLVAYSFVKKWVDSKQSVYGEMPDGEYVYGWEYNLDDEVYGDYAGELLPRAVAYSAGLINYFFRGEIDMVKHENNPGKNIIENHSAEAMDGTCTLYYDDENENRIEVTGASWPCNIAAISQIEVESFTAPTDPKPKKKGEYMLVFEGKLGNEENVSIGKVVTFDSIPSARTVQVGRYGWMGGYITVLTDSGKITEQLPTEGFREVVSVRFDQKDWNTFFVLASYSDSDGISSYQYHKYSIDESSMFLVYHGVPVKDNKLIFNEYSNRVIEEWPDGTYQKIQTLNGIFNRSNKQIYDFSVNDGEIKPFGMIYSESGSGISKTDCYLIDGNGWSCSYGQPLGWLNYVLTQKIYYGDMIQEVTTANCTGGSYDSAGHFEECVGGPVEPGITPLAIFNNTDYAYRYGSELISTLQVEIPSYIFRPNYYMRTMMRENDKYSYFTGKKHKPYLSFSSEIGSVECGGLFMTDIKDGEDYIGWRSGSTISFNSCSDWTTLKRGYINTSRDYLFDVMFQKE